MSRKGGANPIVAGNPVSSACMAVRADAFVRLGGGLRLSDISVSELPLRIDPRCEARGLAGRGLARGLRVGPYRTSGHRVERRGECRAPGPNHGVVTEA